MIYLKEGRTPLNFAYSDEIVHDGNSTYQLRFKFPTNNPLWEELVEETLLLADDLHGEQEFIIFEVEKHHAYISVHANQVATLLNNYSITELSVNNASGDRVMRSLVSSIIRDHKFTFSSDIASTHSINLKNVTVATALFKDKHSILGQWGGDLIRDKYDIRLLSNGGTNKEALFMYKKNLKSYQQKKSIKDLRTRIHFTKTISAQKEGEKDKVIAVTVDSPLISKYKNIYEGNLDVSNQDVIDEVTLRKYGEQYYKTTLCDVIEESIEIDVVGNPDVPVRIFDTVTIFHEKFNLDVKKKITKYTFSSMGRKLKTIGFGKIQQGLGTTLASMIDDAVTEHVESQVDAFKIQKNLSELLKLDRKSIEDKLVDLEEKSNSALEVKRALFEADGNIPDVVKAKILDAVEAEVGRLKTIITEAELIKAIQAKLNYAEIKNTLIDKAFINQIISDEKFTQQFKDGEVTTQNIFTKLKDSIKSNISKDFITKEGVKKLVNDLTIDADGIRQITQQESSKIFEKKKAELKGVDSYLHKKYSDFADGRNMSDNSMLKYIGIYTGDKQQAPTNASEYSWTKIRGEDGARGRDGNNGRDGVSSYIYRKYSDNANGSPMSDNSNLKYIGIYTGTSATAPISPSAYTWSKIKGEDGQQGVPGARGSDGRTSYLHTAYANSATGDRDFSTTNSNGKEYIGTYTDFEINDSNDYRRYKWIKIKGENGRNGTDGHTLTANLRLEGTYINGVTNNVKGYLDVFYDGQKITDGFNAQIKFKGGILNAWSNFWTAKVDNTGYLTNVSWGNKEQQYPIALEVIVLVTYKDLNTAANARLDNVPDARLINETVKKYKTFESTLEGFTSVVGEIDTKVFSKSYFKNNLNSEDVEKTGNDLYFNTKENLQANEYYTILADLENAPTNQKAYLYGASDGGDNKVIQNGLNYWVVKYPSNQTRINLYPLGGNTKVKNVRIFKGDFRVKNDDKRENLYTTYGHDENSGFIHLFLNKNKINGNVYTIKFDASNFPNGAKWDVYNRIGYNQENLTQYFKAKDNELTFTINDTTRVDKMFLRINPKTRFDISNVEIYDVSTESVKNKEVSRLESSIIQAKNEIDLKVSKDNVIASINASVEKNNQGQDQGVVKIKGEVLADNIHGKTFTGSKFKIGQYGFLQPIEKGLQINAPENFGSKRGIGLQIAGEGVGPKENGVPPGLFIYEDPDFTKGTTIPSSVNRVLLTVAGMACFSSRVSGSIVKGQPILTNLESGFPFSATYPVKFIGYQEGGFMRFFGTDKDNTNTWNIKVDTWGSDRKLKTDIKDSEFNAIEFVEKLKFKDHGWNKDEIGYEKPHTKCGLIAQEVQELDDSLVVDYETYLGLDGLRLINISLKAIQELSTENTNLKSQLNEMNERLNKLEDKINGNI